MIHASLPRNTCMLHAYTLELVKFFFNLTSSKHKPSRSVSTNLGNKSLIFLPAFRANTAWKTAELINRLHVRKFLPTALVNILIDRSYGKSFSCRIFLCKGLKPIGHRPAIEKKSTAPDFRRDAPSKIECPSVEFEFEFESCPSPCGVRHRRKVEGHTHKQTLEELILQKVR